MSILKFKTDTLDIARDSPSRGVGLAPDFVKDTVTNGEDRDLSP